MSTPSSVICLVSLAVSLLSMLQLLFGLLLLLVLALVVLVLVLVVKLCYYVLSNIMMLVCLCMVSVSYVWLFVRAVQFCMMFNNYWILTKIIFPTM